MFCECSMSRCLNGSHTLVNLLDDATDVYRPQLNSVGRHEMLPTPILNFSVNK